MNLTRESYDLLTLYQQLKGSQNFSPRPWIVTGSEIAAQIMIGILAVGVSLSVPRRPAVFYNGHDVDAYLTVSALQRYVLAELLHGSACNILGSLFLGHDPLFSERAVVCSSSLEISQWWDT